ncbi:MAG: hypothetical protein ACTSRI_21625 [Promethearchaeota archaeon]
MCTYTYHYGCRNGHHYYRENPHIYPYKNFGKDVYALIAFLRYRHRLAFKKVKESLEKEYHVKRDKETLRNIVLFYRVLNHGFILGEKLTEMREKKGIIPSIDALKSCEN